MTILGAAATATGGFLTTIGSHPPIIIDGLMKIAKYLLGA